MHTPCLIFKDHYTSLTNGNIAQGEPRNFEETKTSTDSRQWFEAVE